MADVPSLEAADGADKVKDVAGSGPVENVEDKVEEKAAEGRTLGAVADKADDAIDKFRGTKD
jgi:hypothetical protein